MVEIGMDAFVSVDRNILQKTLIVRLCEQMRQSETLILKQSQWFKKRENNAETCL